MENKVTNFKEGELVEIEGNKPLLLTDAKSVWIVRSGKVDVFSVRIQNGKAAGLRRYLLRAESGQALFGIGVDSHGRQIGLLASGIIGTKLLKLKRSYLRKLAKDPSFTCEISELIDSWIARISSGICKDVPPKECERLKPGEETPAAEDKSARPKEGIVWVKHVKGTSQFIGKKELLVTDDGNLFPLTGSTWLKSLEENKLYSVDTRTSIEQDLAWSSLEQFHRLVINCIILNEEAARREEHQRLGEKARNDRLYMESAFSRLASILKIGTSKIVISEDETDPLFAACWLVGKALGITMKHVKKGTKQGDSMGDILRASRVQMRKVALKDDWWRRDNGPLLAFMEDRRPVALLPASPCEYELHDPGERTRTRVTPEIAMSLSPFAYSFYRPFPEHALTAFDLFKFAVQGHRNDFIMILMAGIAGGILGMIVPVATGMIFDTIIPGAEHSQLLQIVLALIVSAFAVATFQLTRAIAILRIEGKMNVSVEASVWDRMLSLPVPFFRNYSSGDLSVRAMGINAIRQIITGTTAQAILNSVFSIFSFGLLFYYNAKLALVAAALVLFALACTGILSYLQVRHQRTLLNIQGKISGMVLQFIDGICKLRVSGAEGRAFNIWCREFSMQKKIRFKVGTIANHLSVFNSSFPIISSIVIFVMLIYLNKKVLEAGGEPMSTGIFLAFNAAFVGFLTAVLGMTQALVSSLIVIPLYERAKPILVTLPEVDEAKSAPGELIGSIEVSHINFRYTEDGPLVLKDVSLDINPGEFAAIVGTSGSGKSTLFRLLLGFEKPSSGTIHYDGQDLAGLDVRSVRQQLGVVLQSSQVMSGDIFSNIVGAAQSTLDNAWEAARMAGLDEDIKEMPMGMHTVINYGGTTLSGGQRQRLLIARAIVQKPRIIYFDEATSALDNRTQKIVGKSLENLQATRVVIAHRLSTIMNADRIFVLEAGKLVQSGTYDELISQEGPFAELARRQLA